MAFIAFLASSKPEWQETLDELENVQSTCAAINKDLLHEFESKLDEFESADEKTLCDIVDFFVQKYAELNAEEGGEYILPKELVNLIYWYAVDFEACTTDCAIYNPFAGTPIPPEPTKERDNFPWVLYARKFRARN